MNPTEKSVTEPAVESRHIVLAEDDVEMRRLLADLLRGEGHAVTEVEDGGALLVATLSPRAAPVDLVVTDQRMPVRTGLSVLETLRNSGVSVPVVLMTAFGDDALVNDCQRLGAMVLAKPFKLARLRGLVQAILQAADAG